MSWAAERETGRPEDMAYCLMGLFNVEMPLLYGEGAVKAFRRLQEEIFYKHDFDLSILAWKHPPGCAPTKADPQIQIAKVERHLVYKQTDSFATSPKCFESFTKLVHYHKYKNVGIFRCTTPSGPLVELYVKQVNFDDVAEHFRDSMWPVPPGDLTVSDPKSKIIYISPLCCSVNPGNHTMIYLCLEEERHKDCFFRVGECIELPFDEAEFDLEYELKTIVLVDAGKIYLPRKEAKVRKSGEKCKLKLLGATTTCFLL